MNTRIVAGAVAAAALSAAVAGVALARDDAPAASLAAPARVDNFRLVDHQGFAQDLKRLVDVKAIVVMTQANGDSGSRRAAKALEALKAAHPDVAFFMLNSSPKDERADIAAEASAQGYTIPVLDDPLQFAGEQIGARHVGEALVLEPKTLAVLYRGPIDRAGARKKAKGYLAEALADVKAGRPVQAAVVEAKGAAIGLASPADLSRRAEISYARDVAPILEAKCVTCHQPGGIGPFAMTDYKVVKGFAPMIREAIRTNTMPPWHPDPQVNAFRIDHSLTAEQQKTLVHWVEAGAPRGEGADPLAAAPRVAPEWPLGQPDLVIDIPAYTVPASGVVEYQYPTAQNPLTESRWVRAATLAPGDRQGVHHILAGYISGTPRPGPGSAAQWEASYGEYAVGGESFMVPEGSGVQLPAGGHMGFQMHYTPYGREAVDRSKMGLYFYAKGETPERVMRHYVIADNLIELPPGADHHQEVAYTVFPKDATLYSVFLHTHYRGKSGRVELIRPDGRKETLVNLPRYDFNWQRTYDFAKPVSIPAGSKLVATYWYDNSVRNAANPNPDETVIWGDQSWEEMHYTSIYYEWADETAAKPNDATPQMRASRVMGVLDDTLDGKVELAELRGRVAEALKPRFAEFDANGDGALDDKELAKTTPIVMRLATEGSRAPNRPQGAQAGQ
jgi:hypothetical protein